MNTKQAIIIAFILLPFQLISGQAKDFRKISNSAFVPGEELKFRIHYGIMDAGEAILLVQPGVEQFAGRDCYRVTGTGRSVGAFDWFFKVRDKYESLIDKQSIMPWYFIRRVDEGGYKINQNVTFNNFHDSAHSEKKTISIPSYTQDLISSFYYARTLDFGNAKEGDVFPITGYLDDELIPLNLKFIGREVISSKKGKFRCLKLRPMLQEGRVFKDQEDMTIWVSDDKNKIPVRVQTDILIGSIKMDLVDFKNLANSPALVKE